MSKLRDKFESLAPREKVLVCVALGIAALVMLDRAVFTPLLASARQRREHLESRLNLLAKYRDRVSQEETVSARLAEATNTYQTARRRFIRAKTEALGVAEIQTIVRRLARENSLVVSSSGASQDRAAVLCQEPRTLVLSVDFEIPSDSMRKLQNVLYSLENHPDLTLVLERIRIRYVGLGVLRGAMLNMTLRGVVELESDAGQTTSHKGSKPT